MGDLGNCLQFAGGASSIPDYLLLDGAKIRPLLQTVYRLEPHPDWEALYVDTDLEPLWDLGPFLVRLSSRSALLPAFEQHFGPRGQAVALWSSRSLNEVASHFRRLLILPEPGGPWLFRFYEPRALDRLQALAWTGSARHDDFPSVTPEKAGAQALESHLPGNDEINLLLGPVSQLRWFSARTAQWQDWVNSGRGKAEGCAEGFALPQSWWETLLHLNATGFGEASTSLRHEHVAMS